MGEDEKEKDEGEGPESSTGSTWAGGRKPISKGLEGVTIPEPEVERWDGPV